MKRVYHPEANTWQDVPDDEATEWHDAGWLPDKPKHADDSEALPVGLGYRPPTVVRNADDVAPQPVPEKKSRKRT